MGDNDQETLSNVTGCEWDFDDECFNEISNDAKDFLEKLLVPRERRVRFFAMVPFDSCSEFPRVTDHLLLLFNCRDRMTCEQCSQHNWITGKTFESDVEKHKKSLVVAVGNMKKFVARRKWLVRSIAAMKITLKVRHRRRCIDHFTVCTMTL